MLNFYLFSLESSRLEVKIIARSVTISSWVDASWKDQEGWAFLSTTRQFKWYCNFFTLLFREHQLLTNSSLNWFIFLFILGSFVWASDHVASVIPCYTCVLVLIMKVISLISLDSSKRPIILASSNQQLNEFQTFSKHCGIETNFSRKTYISFGKDMRG